MTESLYVTGQVANTERVMVDIGTGYYIETVSLGALGDWLLLHVTNLQPVLSHSSL